MTSMRCLLLLLLIPGCSLVQRPRPVAVLVCDGDTQQPVAGACVHLTYPLDHPFPIGPKDCTALTGKDGIARLNAYPSSDALLMLGVTANGYILEQKQLPLADVEAVEPPHLFESVVKRPVSLTVEMCPEPSPSVELVLPNGYRGTVKVEVHIQDGMRAPAGQHCFTCTVPPTGQVEITGPPLLRWLVPLDYRARYENGTVLTQDAKGDTIGFWPLRVDGTNPVFLVGTAAEYAKQRGNPFEGIGGSPTSNGGRGSGQSGGRHRRGGQQTPAATSNDE